MANVFIYGRVRKFSFTPKHNHKVEAPEEKILVPYVNKTLGENITYVAVANISTERKY